MSRVGAFNAKGTTSASKFTPRSVDRDTVNNSSGGSYSNARSTSKSKWFTTPSERNKPVNSSPTSMGSTTKSSGIQYFKCGGHGHVIRECPNNHTIIVNDRGEYEYASEDERDDDEVQFQDAEEEPTHIMNLKQVMHLLWLKFWVCKWKKLRMDNDTIFSKQEPRLKEKYAK
jgi:hypothetical protein